MDSYRVISGPNGALARLDDFDGNSLRGYTVAGTDYGTGRLDPDECKAWEAAQGHLVYVVRSYETPIAWVTDDGQRYLVRQRFSVTTSKQQSYVGAWLAGEDK